MTSDPIQITHIPLAEIQPSPINPRKHFDTVSLQELSLSIQAEGVLQPILVRLHEHQMYYEIVAGERRYRASLLAGLDTIPSIIRTLTDDEALEIMITENLQRKEIHPMEEAAGFQQLIRVKKMDIKELAARLGKSPSFVAQRLKLCDLIEPIQQHFFNGYLLVKDALTLSQLRPEDQQELYDDQMHGSDDPLELTDWALRKYQHDLARTTFDIHADGLVKGKPACTICPFNSASAMLFPDQSVEAICHDSACFKSKCDRAFEISLTAIGDKTVQITGQRHRSHKLDKDTQRMLPSLTHLLPFGSYTEVDPPDEPNDRDYFNGDNDTEEEDQADYERHIKEYQAELADFNKKVKAGKYTRAFIVGGDRKGQYTYVEVHRNPTLQLDTSDGATDPADLTADDIADEIRTLQRREMADIRADEQSRWEEIVLIADPSRYVEAAANQKLSVAELQAIARAIYLAVDHQYEIDFRRLFYGGDDGDCIPHGYLKAPHLISDMLRFFLTAILQPHYISGDDDRHTTQLLEACLAEHFEKAIDDIGMRHHQISQARQDQVSARIKVLDKKLKAMQDPKPATKKGKGIKALIPETEQS